MTATVIETVGALRRVEIGARRYLVAVETPQDVDDVQEAGHGSDALLKTLGWSILLTGPAVLPAIQLGAMAVQAAKRHFSGSGDAGLGIGDPAFVTTSVAREMGLSGRRKAVYALHPFADMKYYPLAAYHDLLFQDKQAEMDRILRHLGVKRYECLAYEEVRRGGTAGASASAAGETAGVSAGANKSKTRSVEGTASFPPPCAAPSLPQGLSWYPAEPLWRAMAEARLEHRCLDYAVA